MSDVGPDIEALVARLEVAPDGPTKTAAREVVAGLLSLHQKGIVRMLELVRRRPDGAELVDDLADDPLVGSLLVLHDAHPHDLEARAIQAAERLQGAYPDLELVGVERGVVRVVVGSRGGGSLSPRVVEAAFLEAVPDATAIVVTARAEPELVTLRRKPESP
jgi:hypothetical protein